MCGRYILHAEDELLRFREIMEAAHSGRDSFGGDITPGMRAPALIGGPEGPRAGALYWGLPRPGGSGLVINARAETLASRPMFSSSFASRRCLLPASGFYEWSRPEGRLLRRYRVFPEEGGILYLGGVYSPVNLPGDPKPRWSFVIITLPANGDILPIHSRMPLVIPREGQAAWLARAPFLRPLSGFSPAFRVEAG